MANFQCSYINMQSIWFHYVTLQSSIRLVIDHLLSTKLLYIYTCFISGIQYLICSNSCHGKKAHFSNVYFRRLYF